MIPRTLARPRRPRPAPPTSGCGPCAARRPGPAATSASTSRSWPGSTSRSAPWSRRGSSWSAATRRWSRRPRAGVSTDLQMRIVEAQEAERSPGSPRRSTTARRRRCPTRSSRSSTSSGSSRRTRAWPGPSCASCATSSGASWATSGRFISQLRPPVLDELGLDGAIRDTVATHGVAHPAPASRPSSQAPSERPRRGAARRSCCAWCRRRCRMSASTRAPRTWWSRRGSLTDMGPGGPRRRSRLRHRSGGGTWPSQLRPAVHARASRADRRAASTFVHDRTAVPSSGSRSQRTDKETE